MPASPSTFWQRLMWLLFGTAIPYAGAGDGVEFTGDDVRNLTGLDLLDPRGNPLKPEEAKGRAAHPATAHTFSCDPAQVRYGPKERLRHFLRDTDRDWLVGLLADTLLEEAVRSLVRRALDRLAGSDEA